MDDENCEHDSVSWDPVEIEYVVEDVNIHQEGQCNLCKRLVQREFTTGAAHTVIDDSPEVVDAEESP